MGISRRLKKQIKMKKKEITSDDSEVIAMVVKIVSTYFQTEDIFKNKSRRKKITESRQVCFLFIKQLLPDISLVTIGKHCGGYDHSSVIYSIRTIKNLSVFDMRVKNDLVAINKLIEDYEKTPFEKNPHLVILAKKIWDDLADKENSPYTDFESYFNSLVDENGKFTFEIPTPDSLNEL